MRLRLACFTAALGALGPSSELVGAPSVRSACVTAQEAQPSPAPFETLDDALARARASLFGRGAQTLVSTSGTVELATGPTPFRWIFAPDGSFLLETKGRAASSLRSVGDEVWRSDLNGPTWAAGGLEAERAKLLAWIWGGAWAKERAPLERELLPVATGEDPSRGGTPNGAEPPADARLRLELPEGTLRATLVLDGATARPKELRLGPEFGDERFRFDDWQLAGELWLPGRVELVAPDGAQRAFVVQDARPWTRHAPAFGRPERVVQTFNRADFRRGADPEVEAVLDESGALLVAALINDLPARFELDPSCGPSEIERSVADSLRLSRSRGGARLAFDADAPPGSVQRASGRALVVGPFARSFPMFREVEGLEEWTARSRAGRLGWDVFSRAVAEVDLAAPTVALHSPADWEAPEEVDWAELAFHWTTPHVRVELGEGREAWLRLAPRGAPSVLYAESLAALAARPFASNDGEFHDASDADGPGSRPLQVVGREVAARVTSAPAGTLHLYSHGELSLDALGERWIVDFPGARLGVLAAD